MAAADTDYHQRDLYDHIERGEYPSWTLKMQIMPFEEAGGYRFNPFDLTKVWPHSDYPLIEVGRLTLDRNVTDYHTEIEQAAFEPNNLVPGITPQPGQDAARPRVLLLRRAPGPARGELQADPGQRSGRAGAQLQQGRGDARGQRASTLSTRRTPRAVPRPTASTTSRSAGTPTARWCGRPTRCTSRTTTSARPAPWSARCWTTPPASRLVGQHRRAPAERRDRAGPGARLRVLAERRQGPRRPGRVRRPREAEREGPEGRRAGKPGPLRHAGEGLRVPAGHDGSGRQTGRATAAEP